MPAHPRRAASHFKPLKTLDAYWTRETTGKVIFLNLDFFLYISKFISWDPHPITTYKHNYVAAPTSPRTKRRSSSTPSCSAPRSTRTRSESSPTRRPPSASPSTSNSASRATSLTSQVTTHQSLAQSLIARTEQSDQNNDLHHHFRALVPILGRGERRVVLDGLQPDLLGQHHGPLRVLPPHQLRRHPGRQWAPR